MRINYDNTIRERFIPISYDELLDSLLLYLDSKHQDKYHRFKEALHHYYYEKFYSDLIRIEQSYKPFNPDSDIVSNIKISDNTYLEKEQELYDQIAPILNNANYEILTKEILEETMNKTSPYGVEVSVDFDDFEEIQLYFRGESIQIDEVPDPKKLYLSKKSISEPVYRRLFLLIKPKQLDTRAKEIAGGDSKNIEKIKRKLARQKPLLITDKTNRNIYIKLFKNIPHMDLEMLFPNTKVKMTLFDKVKLSVVGGGGTIGGGATLVAKLGVATVEPTSAMMAIMAFGGILWRQVKEVFSRRTHYLAKLSQKLYFHNLDNNSGALNYMLSMAQDEESKEALLTYLFLSHYTKGMSLEELDRAIERYIKEIYGIDIDFEVDDGIDKLHKLGLIIEQDHILSVVDIDQAIDILEKNDTQY